ncbi:hypothetical protein CVT26_011664 [Gymnopilus dilepis]|uniref:Small nuclear ribonucleoprotein Prp3 C-terminal domain-containing protein n=1 Tax=Gymnopilus dilepis TaxID=231916 RepID=A0A409W8X5_9AGAR|nr:hypothetical protein CVT26_011664 [Gymnopilus dilepis]
MPTETLEGVGRLLEELQLIQCSLLPDEHLSFLDEAKAWTSALDRYSEDSAEEMSLPGDEACFSVQLTGGRVWFEVKLSTTKRASVSVKGENITRDEQERWQRVIAENLELSKGIHTEYPIYELLSSELLPLLREDMLTKAEIEKGASGDTSASKRPQSTPKEIYHALFTSHHLISPNKRRSLQQWSSSLSLAGFAKVGYPGVIYAQGEKGNIEDFVENVKAMQWLALKLRFVEPLPLDKQGGHADATKRSWKEFEKVGEVVEEMRKLGREEYVVEMGIGSAGTK